MFVRSVNRDQWGVHADALVASAIHNAERRSKRFGDTFFVVRFTTGIEVISEGEKRYRSREIIDLIYNTSSGFEVGSSQLERWRNVTGHGLEASISM